MKTLGSGQNTRVTVKESFEDVWARIFPLFSENFRLTEEEQEKFSNNKTLQLIAYTPWLADCYNKEQTALTNMAIFMVSSFGESKYYFDHTPLHDISPVARLNPLMNFCGGNKAIIDRAINALALVILHGYNQDRAKDMESGEYNPLNSGAWDFDTIRKSLEDAIQSVGCPEMDVVFNPDDMKRGSWAA